MHSATTASARRAPANAKSNFVSFPARSAALDLTAKSALLLALRRYGRAQPGNAPLVGVSVTTPDDLGLSTTLVKKVSKRTICLDLENNPGTIQSALMGEKSRCLDQTLLKKRTLYVDEAYLHNALKPWEMSSPAEKAILAAASMDGDRVLAFSVNFGDRRSIAGRSQDKILRRLRNELGELGQLGPVVVVIEKDSDGRDHLHGLVQTGADMATVKGQLLRLGGRTSNYRFRNLYQVRLDERFVSMGWCHYMLKEVALSATGAGKQIYMSPSAKGSARQLQDELVWVSRRKLMITPERRGRANVNRPSSSGKEGLGRKFAA